MTEEIIPQLVPHAARMVNQFRLEVRDGKKTWVSTGKVMCWCNCGETTGWLDIHEDTKPVHEFLDKHEVAEELGIRMYYHLGELTGYSIEHSGIANPSLTLMHRCGWQKDIMLEENLMTNLILEIINDKHVCLNGERRS